MSNISVTKISKLININNLELLTSNLWFFFYKNRSIAKKTKLNDSFQGTI